MRVEREGSKSRASDLVSLDGEISGSGDIWGAEFLGKVEGFECVGMAGWSEVNGVNWLWGASSARTKAAGSPLMLSYFHAEKTQRRIVPGMNLSGSPKSLQSYL